MSTVLVTGANGFVGSHAIPALLDAGHRVLALVRDDKGAEEVLARLAEPARSSVEIRRGDVTKPNTLPAALAGADAVLHLAAIARDWDNGASLRLVNTEGTRNLVAAATGEGVTRFVHLGALAVVDDPALHYASSKFRAMAIVRESGLRWTILSPSLLFGPRDGFFNILAGLVRMSPGIVPITGKGEARFQPLAIEDLARVAIATLGDDATIGREYPLGGPRTWTSCTAWASAGCSSRCRWRSSGSWPACRKRYTCRSPSRPTSCASSSTTTWARWTPCVPASASTLARWRAA